MPFYRVHVEATYDHSMDVEADSYEQAQEIACSRFDINKASHVETSAVEAFCYDKEKQNG